MKTLKRIWFGSSSIFTALVLTMLLGGCQGEEKTGEWSTVVTETQEVNVQDTSSTESDRFPIKPQKTNVKDAPDIPSVDQVFQIEEKEKEWTDMETQWRIHVLEPTYEGLDVYIQACIDYGFNCNANMGEHFLYAETDDAEWFISVQYFEKDEDDLEDISKVYITLEKLEESEVSVTEN